MRHHETPQIEADQAGASRQKPSIKYKLADPDQDAEKRPDREPQPGDVEAAGQGRRDPRNGPRASRPARARRQAARRRLVRNATRRNGPDILLPRK